MRALPDQQATAARTLLVAVTAGLPITAGMELAAGSTTGVVASEIRAVLRRAHREGMSAALSIWAGPHTRALCSRLALAAVSGASVAEAVAAYLSELRSERRASTLERVRRLPVSLMVPLGLLILPGFVALFVGPIVFRSLTELIGTLP
jgi:tight adherence protein B